MSSLNIDFRGESLRVLAVRDGAVRHTHLSRQFMIADLRTAKEALSAAIHEAGGKKGKVQVILPSRLIRFRIFQMPAMDIGDAEKVARREIAKELGSQEFVMGVRRLVRNTPGKQDILAEYALVSDMQTHLGLLRECGLRPSLISTSLEGIIKSFNHIRPETDGNEAILEVGLRLIEIIIINDGRLINYKKIMLPPVDETKLSSKDMDQTQINKIKMYTIVDALYNFIMETSGGSDEDKISRLWISGLGSREEGTTGCVTEGLGITCQVLNPFETDVEDASVYTALAGLSRFTPADKVINLLPQKALDSRKQAAKRTVLVAAVIFYAVMLTAGYVLLGKTDRDLRLMTERASAERARLTQQRGAEASGREDTARRLLANDRDLYAVFREIANLIPPDISLASLDIEKTPDKTYLRLGSVLQAGDAGLRNASVSKFLDSLEGTGRLKMAGPPEITTGSRDKKKQQYMVRAKFEVLK